MALYDTTGYQYRNPYATGFQNQMQQQPGNPQYGNPQHVTPQISGTGLISVANEQIARTWPVAPGNSLTFKDENAPYVYTKTMGFSQLDQPIFEKYRLVKEEQPVAPQTQTEYALKSDLVTLLEAYRKLENEVKTLKGNPVSDEQSIIRQEVGHEQNV